MLKKKCQSCAQKSDRKSNYCSYCGASFKANQDSDDFGMLGRNDSENLQEEVKLPFGVDKIMNSLIKQLEKQLDGTDLGGAGLPKGIQIKFSRGPPMQNQQIRQVPKRVLPIVSEEESQRRMKLPKVDAQSKVKRLADNIIYEIEAPGISRTQDVLLTELASGLEIKAYSKDKCYTKFIPLKVEVIRYSVTKEKVIVELRG